MSRVIEGELIVANKKLDTIVKKINASYAKANDHVNQAMKYSIDVGNYLIEAKEEVPHGEWENWVKTTVQLSFSSPSQAKSYMRLAKDSNLALLVNDGTIEGTLKLMKDASPEQLEEVEDMNQAEAEIVNLSVLLNTEFGVNVNTARKHIPKICADLGITKEGRQWKLTDSQVESFTDYAKELLVPTGEKEEQSKALTSALTALGKIKKQDEILQLGVQLASMLDGHHNIALSNELTKAFKKLDGVTTVKLKI